MPNLLPYRAVDELEVINMFAYSGDASSTVGKGTCVKIIGSGAQLIDSPVIDIGTPGASYSNTVSMRYGGTWKITDCTTGVLGTKDTPLGLTLWDVRETDEHGQKLQFSPDRADARQAVLSGQVVPVVTRGLLYYSGTLTQGGEGNVAPNAKVYTSAGGELTTSTDGTLVGKTLGATDANLHILLKVEL